MSRGAVASGFDRLGLRLPIVAAPMLGVTTPELAAAASAAGGLGVLAWATLGPGEMRAQLRRARELTDGPIGVNLFASDAPARDLAREGRALEALRPLYEEISLEEPGALSDTGPGVDDARLAFVRELAPELVSFHFGLPARDWVDALRAAGIVVATSATTVAEARAAARGGADIVIAQGGEAGGHRGTRDPDGEPVGTIALVPQVVDAVGVPVIAAGGIADGRGVAAALALGAVAAQVGTAFIACPESAADDDYRRALAGTPAEATVITRAFSGRPARARRNRVSETVRDPAATAAFPLQRQLTAPLAAGGVDYRPLWMGQAAALARAEPAGEVTRRLARDAQSVLAGVASSGG